MSRIGRMNRKTERGAAALAVVLLLFLVLALALVYTSRTLLVDGRTSRSQVQASQAFEAAEAGAEWATALLNKPHALDDACMDAEPSAGRSLRDRLLTFDADSGRHLPRTWSDDSGIARPLEVACRAAADGWQCSCPRAGAPRLPVASGSTPRPAFRVSLQAGTRAGTVQLTSVGCNNDGPACVTDTAAASEARAQVQVLLGLLPALFTPPAATLTAGGDIVAPSASPGLVNTDASSGGATVDVGGAFQVPGADVRSAPGALPSLSITEHDASLRALPADRLFARHFGLDKPTWRQRPDVTRVTCADACASRADAALASGASLLWIDGDLVVDSAVAWGTPTRPVVVVVTGGIRFGGRTTIHGLVYARDVVWNDAASGPSSLHGALVAEERYAGNGSPELVRDATVLKLLNSATGAFVRLPGSWKDF